MGKKEERILFTPCPIGRKQAPNRLVSQPMESNDGGPGGTVSERTLERYKNLARGEWGIVVVEALSISETSLASKNGLIINRKNLDGFKRLVETFKAVNPDALIFFQLTHSGPKTGPFSRLTTLCPEGPPGGAHYLSSDDISRIRKAFVEGALMAESTGADGIDFKLAHGYLGTEMLRPSNTRDDQWGGSIENRTRFLRESMGELKDRLDTRDFVLGSRVSMYEGIRGGCGTAGPDELIEDLSEMEQVIRMMDGLEMDYTNVSAGLPGVTSDITIPIKASRNFYLNQFRYAKRVKAMGTRMCVIGSAYSILGKRAPDLAEENISKDYTDFAGFGRQSLADPLYPRKLRQGEKIHYCVACSGCGRLIEHQRHAGCVVYNDYYKGLNRQIRDT